MKNNKHMEAIIWPIKITSNNTAPCHRQISRVINNKTTWKKTIRNRMFAENSTSLPPPLSRKNKNAQTTDDKDTIMSNTLKEIRRKLSDQSIVRQPDSQIDEPVDWRDKQKSILSKNSIISTPDYLLISFTALSCFSRTALTSSLSLHSDAIFLRHQKLMSLTKWQY